MQFIALLSAMFTLSKLNDLLMNYLFDLVALKYLEKKKSCIFTFFFEKLYSIAFQVHFIFQVDEGIEAMLCCWLQQLQEFGGPEVEKPDLLQGSGGNARTPLRGGSSPSLAKQLILDPRVRYNVSLNSCTLNGYVTCPK